MSQRLSKFHSFREHLIIGACFRCLRKVEVEECEKFILENDQLDIDQFAFKVNRWFLDVPAESAPTKKRQSAMWALVSQANGSNIKRRGEL